MSYLCVRGRVEVKGRSQVSTCVCVCVCECLCVSEREKEREKNGERDRDREREFQRYYLFNYKTIHNKERMILVCERLLCAYHMSKYIVHVIGA